MIRDITIGQYYPADSLLHKLDPRVKLFATVIYVIALFSFKGILGLAIISGFLFGLSVKYIVSYIRYECFFCIIIIGLTYWNSFLIPKMKLPVAKFTYP